MIRKILAATAGDVIGSSYECKKDRIKTTKFDLFTERSCFTDDTVCTAALCRWLMEDESHSHEHLAKCLLDLGLRYYNPKGIQFGPGFRSWLLQEAAATILGGPHIQGQSLGNGSAMRVSPVGLYANSMEEALTLATISAEVTHNNPEGIKGAKAIAGCMYLAKTGHTKEEIKDYVSSLGYDMNRTIAEIRPTYKFQDTCEKSVGEAVIAYLEANSFEETIRLVVSLGGDADTQGAIVCPVAAVTDGMEMPEEIFEKTISRLDGYLWTIFSQFEAFLCSLQR